MVYINYGIIVEGGSSPLVSQISDALIKLGLTSERSDVLTHELIEALNVVRQANGLPMMEICDPVVLRLIGIDAAGDDVTALAAYVQKAGSTELEYYGLACDVIDESRNFGLTLCEAISRRGYSGSSAEVTPEAAAAVILALARK